LSGDFNARPESDEIRFLTACAVIDGRSTYFVDAWTPVNDDGGFTQDLSNERYLEVNEPPKRIDYVSSLAMRVGDPTAPDACRGHRSHSTAGRPEPLPATTLG
jgi:hypothetical protein